jgi:hypothetical protein
MKGSLKALARNKITEGEDDEWLISKQSLVKIWRTGRDIVAGVLYTEISFSLWTRLLRFPDLTLNMAKNYIKLLLWTFHVTSAGRRNPSE